MIILVRSTDLANSGSEYVASNRDGLESALNSTAEPEYRDKVLSWFDQGLEDHGRWPVFPIPNGQWNIEVWEVIL